MNRSRELESGTVMEKKIVARERSTIKSHRHEGGLCMVEKDEV